MDVNLVIPRHEYRSLRDGRESISLSPEGKAALDRLATCSRSAAVDLAVRVLDTLVFAEVKSELDSIGLELAGVINSDDGLAWVSSGFERLAEVLDSNLKIPTS